MGFHRTILALVAVLVLAGAAHCGLDPAAQEDMRQRATAAQSRGNYKDAMELFAKLATDSATDEKKVAGDLEHLVQCVSNLGRIVEIDALLEKAVAAHPKNPRLLMQAANNYLGIPHQGSIVAGNFERGGHRGGTAKYVEVSQRDRVRALQLMVQGLPTLPDIDDRQFMARYYLRLADILLTRRWGHDAWALQDLTDLAKLPDPEDMQHYYSYYGHGSKGAPVDEKGDPIFHTKPASWDKAQTDGQRWRWALESGAALDENVKRQVKRQLADFLQGQFGVQTMAQYGHLFRGQSDEKADQAGPFALRSLGEDETIARLASGIRRFKLPDEFNPIAYYKEMAEQNDHHAWNQLGQIFEDRQQYPRAAEFWEKSRNQHRLDQIRKPWGTFENAGSQVAGTGATTDYRFRNGKKVKFTAFKIELQTLLDDIRAYLRRGPNEQDWEKIDVTSIGQRLVHGKQLKYKGPQVAQWELDLEPRAEHLDRRVTVTTPLTTGGAYLVEAQMEGGNHCSIVLWVADLAIVKKQLDQKLLYYVADAATGQPVAGAELKFFGYRAEWHDQWMGGRQRIEIKTQEAAFKTDADGQAQVSQSQVPQEYQWLVETRDGSGKMGFLGWTHQGYGGWYDAEYSEQKSFFISDRPVYRPGHTVKYKFWVGHAQYDREGRSPQAGANVSITVQTPKGESTQIKTGTLDEYGGIDGEWTVPADATLGMFSLSMSGGAYAGGQFRVEEYKKPEFEVNVDAPSEPVMLGEKFEAKIEAKYLFGAPVKEGKFKYKVTRVKHDATWYPWALWDWYYGRGYWWFACDYLWYPGWYEWGCKRPVFGWLIAGGGHHGRGRHFGEFGGWAPPQPPEIVAENEGEIADDGKITVPIDTALAKATQGDSDHKYEITAEVTDKSRRTITGTGSVLVARKPFKVYAWLDRGHFRVGDTIDARFNAQTIDGKPVSGNGDLKLYKLSYDKDGKPIETEVQKWSLPSGPEGKATQQLKASEPGQYRISYTVTDSKSHAIEGGYVFVIAGQGFDGADFRFNDLELIADKKEYKPDEKVNLRIQTNNRDGVVLLFPRASNGVCLAPKTIRLKGKSVVEEIAVAKKDMPNFFVEALTVAGGKVHQETIEVVVPPEDRVLEVKVTADAERVKPGGKSKVTVQLTQANGEPYAGSLAVAMYDKAVEYIAGGPVGGDIRETFWKWRRHHSPHRETSLDRASYVLVRAGEQAMQFLGTFGAMVADGDKRERKGAANGGGGATGRAMMRSKSAAFEGAPVQALAAAAPAPMAPGAAREESGADMQMAMGKLEAADEMSDKRRDSNVSGEPGGAAPLAPAAVRQNFADTAFWAGALTTDASGKATFEVDMPENLTTWKTRVWAMGLGTRVGQGETAVITSKNVLVRLQAPRFFVEKDEVVLSGNVHNYLKTKKSLKVSLALEGDTLAPAPGTELEKTVEVDAGGEARVDWRVIAKAEGKAVVRMQALSDEESDAVQMDFPVLVHGFLKTESFCGVLRPEQNAGKLELKVPEERKPEQSRLELRYSPTLALAMVDALPYMVEYPYGCTEQTLNRFLPTVITQKVLIQLGVDLKDIQAKITNLNAQEIGEDQKRAKDWQRLAGTRRWDGKQWVARNPVFDETEVRAMIKFGLDRLTGMQCSDGGWGWFSGTEERSTAHTTAVVVHGLQVARFADQPMASGMLERGIQWLKGYQAEELRKLKLPEGDSHRKVHADALDAFVSMILADAKTDDAEMRERIYKDRNELPVYAKCMLGLALHRVKDNEKRDMVIQNVEQFLVQDAENHTAYLKLPENNWWWYWYGSEYEAQGYYLKLLAAAQPKSEKASRIVKYLLNNRRNATYWNSTRDTAVVIEAFADYIEATGEAKPQMSVEVILDGKSIKTVNITPDTLFSFDNKFVLTGPAVTDGPHTLELKKVGSGPLYYNAYLTNFTMEDRITKAGLEVKIERAFYKLVREDAAVKAAGDRGQVLTQKIEKYRREPIADLATLKSGDLVEVELVVDSKNDYEYIMLEDAKAAGFEPVEVRSGYNGNDMGAYVEFRDQKVTFFVAALARGKHSVSYRLRAEIPGKFSALPARAAAMYAPELRGNSDEFKVGVED